MFGIFKDEVDSLPIASQRTEKLQEVGRYTCTWSGGSINDTFGELILTLVILRLLPREAPWGKLLGERSAFSFEDYGKLNGFFESLTKCERSRA